LFVFIAFQYKKRQFERAFDIPNTGFSKMAHRGFVKLGYGRRQKAGVAVEINGLEMIAGFCSQDMNLPPESQGRNFSTGYLHMIITPYREGRVSPMLMPAGTTGGRSG
tara:strand:+ start:1175 stop:1498 length:324 start_codon:yes stop_codon:yes gene_type:complete